MSAILKYVLGSLLTIDLLILNYGFVRSLENPKVIPLKTESIPTPTQIQKLTPTLISQPASTATPTKPLPKKLSSPKVKTVAYVPIPGSGSILNPQWTDIPGTEFSINTDDYPNLTDARFEANMKLLNGNGKAFLRLFDTTVGIEVWGSQIETGSQNFTFVTSGEIYIRPGNHLYKIQAKSLTADTTVLNSARIKIVSEN
ncbi:MAG: hypothetical protein WC841_00030 [Candidatus Shapirobacteria bacterium]|jgi:hypothetical protein